MGDREGLPESASAPGEQQGEPSRPDPYGLCGQTVAHYAIQDVLGGGGMGVVYRAEDTRLRRTVALKFLPPRLALEARAKARFMTEAQAASALDHPNICTVHEIGETSAGQPFIAMAYYPGASLRATLARGALAPEEAADLVAQVARGLAAAHAAGIVHRDVKPDNVIVTPEGVAKLVDFGVAKVADTLLTQTGATLGTLAYMSPEQTRGDAVDARTDIWALGAVLYEALTGARPFRGAYDQAVVYSILHEEAEPVAALNPDVPPPLGDIVARCLQKDPAQRYPDAQALATDLDAFRQGTATSAGGSAEDPTAVAEAPSRRVRPGLALGGLGALALLAALLLAWPAAEPGERPRSAATASGLRQVAVLPFANVGGDAENQAFIDGLVYTIGATLTEMEQFSNRLSVLPTDDALSASARSPREAATALGADLVVSGSVQRAAERIRLTLEVYDAHADRRLGSRLLDKTTTDLLALQDSVAITLASLLDVELNEAAREALAAGGTTSPVAYDRYTQARGYLQDYETEANVDRAIALFRRALDEDDRYALAWAGLGEAYWRKYELSNDPAWVERASEAGERAVALDENLARVRVTLGMIYKGTGRYEQAERELRRALALDPSDAVAHQQLASTYYNLGRLDEAEAEYKRAIALKPGYWAFYNNLGNVYRDQERHEDALPLFRRVVALHPDNPWGYSNLGGAHYSLGRSDSAIVWYRRATEVNPAATGPTALAYINLGQIYLDRQDYDQAVPLYRRAVALDSMESDNWYFLGNAYYLAGRHAEAERAWRRMITLDEQVVEVNPNDEDGLIGLAYGYAWTDQPERAQEPLRRLVALTQKRVHTHLLIARIYERLGDRAAALHSLEEGLNRGLAVREVESSPWLDALRADPRYRSLIQAHPRQG